MDMTSISREHIHPSSPSILHQCPFKLSLLDQLFPTTYVPYIFFYLTNDTPFNNGSQISAKLKGSLSQTLSTFYPLSGRVKSNCFIDNYEKGVPFIEKSVNGCLLDFLKQPRLNLLHNFLPCQPLGYEPDPEAAPQVAIQVTTFNCGGIALGLCFSHKINDVATSMAFLNSWASNARGSCNDNIYPHLFEASSQFPPRNSFVLQIVLQIALWLKEKYLFIKQRNVTKRFIFSANAIAALREKAKSKQLSNPSRTETLSAFIWKSCTEASRLLNSFSRPSLSLHAVNIRQRAEPCFSRYSFGNLWWYAFALYDQLADTKVELNDFVTLTRESFKKIDHDYLKAFQGENGFQHICQSSLKDLVKIVYKNPETFIFSSWLHFGLNDVDFGWGKPIWVGLAGEAGWTNVIFFKETGSNDEIEVWMTLNEKIMYIVERDPEFLQFATPNPGII